MKKYTGIFVGVVVVLAFVLYYFLSGSNGATIAGTPASTSTGIADTGGLPSATPTGTPAAEPNPTPTPTPAPAPKPVPKPVGQYKDGTYLGTVADAVYGQLQVVATIQGGKLIDTNCPVYPSDSGHSREVSNYALPQLRQEAISSQSANVNIVSGATQTSLAYQQSLAAALAMAKN